MERIASDPLHRFEKKAGQRHSFTTVVCSNFLKEKIYILNLTLLPRKCLNKKLTLMMVNINYVQLYYYTILQYYAT